MLDNIFKIGLLILGILFLLELHNVSKNGRYSTTNGFTVLDSQTGVLYDEDSGPQGSPGSLIYKRETIPQGLKLIPEK